MKQNSLIHLANETSAESQKPIPLIFGPQDSQLFGWLHLNTTAQKRVCGVVLCHPFGHEAMCVYRSYRHLAKQLAQAGFCVLRFDYLGTGNSSDEGDDKEHVATWLDSIHHAITALKTHTGVTKISLFGVRLGGTLAMMAAQDRHDIASLVLWTPVTKGNAYVREIRALGLLKKPTTTSQKDEPHDHLEAAGMYLSASTISELNKIDLFSDAADPVKNILLLHRDDLPNDPHFMSHLTNRGTQVQQQNISGYALLMRDPHQSVVPEAVFATVTQWLTDIHPSFQNQSVISKTKPKIDFVVVNQENAQTVHELAVFFW